MSALAGRISKLEDAMGTSAHPPRIIAVRSNGASDAQIDAFLAAQEIGFDRNVDDVVHLCLFSGARDGAIELMNITEVKRGRVS